MYSLKKIILYIPSLIFGFFTGLKNFLYKKMKHYSVLKSNLIIVIGGDGFMLEALKKYNKYKNIFRSNSKGQLYMVIFYPIKFKQMIKMFKLKIIQINRKQQ